MYLPPLATHANRLEDPAFKLPHGIFECQPCIGKRIISLNLQIDSDTVLSCVITGSTYNFRSRLDWRRETIRMRARNGCGCKHTGNFSHQSDAAGIPGGWSGDSDDPNRKYLRVLRDIDCSSEDQRKKFTDMVGDGVTVVGVI